MAAQQPNDPMGNQYQGGPGPKYPSNSVIDNQTGPQAPPQAGTGPAGQTAQGLLGNVANFQQTTGAYSQPMGMDAFGSAIQAPTFAAPTVTRQTVEGPQIDYSQYGPYTREMTDEELTSRQLQGLLASDSPYMRQAALAGQRMAAQRGALSSSIAAGASQASAIQAAFPIAAADAQAFQQMRSQNAAAINNTNLAKLQSATNMATSKLQSLTALATTTMQAETQSKVAALNANVQSQIAAMEAQSRREALVFQAAHDRSMQALQQQGQMNLAAFQQAGRMDLAAFEQAGRMDLAAAQNDYALQQLGYQGNISAYLLDQELRASMFQSANSMFADMLSSIGLSGMDPTQMPAAVSNMMAAFNTAFNINFETFYGSGGGGG